MKLALILNPRSGGAERIKQLLPRLNAVPTCEVLHCDSSADVRKQVESAVADGTERIVVAGGDGTIHQAITALGPGFPEVQMAFLPTGTGNDFVRCLGIDVDNIELAWQRAFDPEARTWTIDLIKVEGGPLDYAINAINGGIGGAVAMDVGAEEKHRWGAIAYWMHSLSRIADPEPYDVQLQIDGEVIERRIYGIVVANGCYIGGGFPAAPSARVDDGLLDVTLLPVMPMMELMAVGLNFTFGWEAANEHVESFRGKSIKLRSNPALPLSVDGEPSRAFDANFEALPCCVTTVVGDVTQRRDASPGQQAEVECPCD